MMTHLTKNILTAFFVLMLAIANCQVKKAAQLYNDGVIFYNQQAYGKAEELFTKSLEILKDRDTYFNRGLCRGKMANKEGYCQDMATVGLFGDERALKLFTKSCGSVDTEFVITKEPARKYISRVITYHSGKNTYQFKQRYYSQVCADTTLDCGERARHLPEADSAASFPGGMGPMYEFFSRKTEYPRNLDGDRSSGKVLIKLTVFEDSTLHNIEVQKGMPDCPTCDEEVTRLVIIMPRWIPAILNGNPVKSAFSFPFSFKTIN
jgi:hypothetical protein